LNGRDAARSFPVFDSSFKIQNPKFIIGSPASHHFPELMGFLRDQGAAGWRASGPTSFKNHQSNSSCAEGLMIVDVKIAVFSSWYPQP